MEKPLLLLLRLLLLLLTVGAVVDGHDGVVGCVDGGGGCWLDGGRGMGRDALAKATHVVPVPREAKHFLTLSLRIKAS